MTTLYRIHVEAVSLSRIAALTSESFEAFTLSESTGYWRGTPERSATIEVYAHADDAPIVEALAERLRATFNQEAVLVASFPTSSALLKLAPFADAA